MADDTGATVSGIPELQAKLAQMPVILREALTEIEPEVSATILANQGGGHPFYPPETEHNQPPVPYYRRYYGEEWAGHNSANSEQLGERFETGVRGLDLFIRNTASYAQKVIGLLQDPFFAAIGWQKLINVARNTMAGTKQRLAVAIGEGLRRVFK